MTTPRPGGGWSRDHHRKTKSNAALCPGLPSRSNRFCSVGARSAKLTGFSEASVIRWENSGLLRPVKIGIGANARVRYAAPQVYALMQGRR